MYMYIYIYMHIGAHGGAEAHGAADEHVLAEEAHVHAALRRRLVVAGPQEGRGRRLARAALDERGLEPRPLLRGPVAEAVEA